MAKANPALFDIAFGIFRSNNKFAPKILLVWVLELRYPFNRDGFMSIRSGNASQERRCDKKKRYLDWISSNEDSDSNTGIFKMALLIHSRMSFALIQVKSNYTSWTLDWTKQNMMSLVILLWKQRVMEKIQFPTKVFHKIKKRSICHQFDQNNHLLGSFAYS